MKTLNINGSIIDDGDNWIYDWFGIPSVSPQSVSDFLSEAGGEDVKLSINSGGGSVYAGSDIYTQLMNYSGQVTAEVTGLCASIASVIMLAADKVSVSPVSTIMIHNVWSVTQGDYQEHEHQADVLKDMSNSIAQMYAKRTGMTVEEAQAAMDKETYYTADQAVEAGLADEKLFEEETAPLQMVASMTPMLSSEKIKELRDRMNLSQTIKIAREHRDEASSEKLNKDMLEEMLFRVSSIESRLGINYFDEYSWKDGEEPPYKKFLKEEAAKMNSKAEEAKEVNNSADKPSKNQLNNFIFGGK